MPIRNIAPNVYRIVRISEELLRQATTDLTLEYMLTNPRNEIVTKKQYRWLVQQGALWLPGHAGWCGDDRPYVKVNNFIWALPIVAFKYNFTVVYQGECIVLAILALLTPRQEDFADAVSYLLGKLQSPDGSWHRPSVDASCAPTEHDVREQIFQLVNEIH